jgi:hypothetical protein
MLSDNFFQVADKVESCPVVVFVIQLDVSTDVRTLAHFLCVQNENTKSKLFALQNFENNEN